MVLKNFDAFLRTNQIKVFAFFYKILSVTRLKDPIAVILTLKMHTESRNLSYEISIKTACDSKFRRNFTAATL